MSRLGTSCLVTYYQTHQDQLDRMIIPLKLAGRGSSATAIMSDSCLVAQ